MRPIREDLRYFLNNTDGSCGVYSGFIVSSMLIYLCNESWESLAMMVYREMISAVTDIADFVAIIRNVLVRRGPAKVTGISPIGDILVRRAPEL